MNELSCIIFISEKGESLINSSPKGPCGKESEKMNFVILQIL